MAGTPRGGRSITWLLGEGVFGGEEARVRSWLPMYGWSKLSDVYPSWKDHGGPRTVGARAKHGNWAVVKARRVLLEGLPTRSRCCARAAVCRSAGVATSSIVVICNAHVGKVIWLFHGQL